MNCRSGYGGRRSANEQFNGYYRALRLDNLRGHLAQERVCGKPANLRQVHSHCRQCRQGFLPELYSPSRCEMGTGSQVRQFLGGDDRAIAEAPI